MKLSTLIVSILIVMGAGPALAQLDRGFPQFRLQIGSTVMVGIDGQGRPEVDGAAATLLSPAEIDLVRQLVTEHPDAFGPKGVFVHTDIPIRPVTPNHIRFSFIPFQDGRQTLLMIENGFDGSFIYTANIGHGAKRARTDVCQVMPGKRGVEHWPYPIDWIEISDIRPIKWKDGDPPRCE